MTPPTVFQSMFEPWLLLLAEDPTLRLLQLLMLVVGLLIVFLVFYTTRDILLRSESFWFMFFSIVLVAALPVVGFLLYLLIRPARTVKEREWEKMLRQLTTAHKHAHGPQKNTVTSHPAPQKAKVKGAPSK